MKTFQDFIKEAGDWWHPDPKKDRAISGVGNKQRAREDLGKSSARRVEPDYSNKLKPGESYLQFDKRKKSQMK